MEPTDSTRPISIRGWVIPFASIVHLIWAFVLLFEPKAVDIAPIFQLAEWVNKNHLWIAAIFFVSGALAWIGSVLYRTEITGVVMGIPQLLLVTFGAGSCIEIIIAGTHPDGTVNGHLFFIAQLANSIVLAPIYFLAIYQPYWKAIWRTFHSG